jgi:hypothetical protein
MTQSCRTCKWLQGEKFRKGYVYKCGWIAPEIALPDSITRYLKTGFPDIASRGRTYMDPTDGTNCPVYEKVK